MLEQLELTTAKYNKYKTMSLIICSGDEELADELLHITLDKIFNTITDINKIDDYIFISLRNNHITMMKKLKNTESFEESLYERKLDLDDIIDESKFRDEEKETQDKLNSLIKCYDTLNDYEQKLYYLRYVKDKSGREISRLTGIPNSAVAKHIIKLKSKLVKYYEDNKQ